jgi:single-strand DNA-binding protein
MNIVILIGRLTKDPELRYTPTGKPVTTFTIATDRRFSVAGSDQTADFHNIVVWNELAETCSNYLKKGRLVSLIGRTENRKFTVTVDGIEQNRYITEVVAREVEFLDSLNKEKQQ